MRSVAQWYGLKLKPVAVDAILDQHHVLGLGQSMQLNILHAPGHNPGSLSAWCQQAKWLKVLFGQDVRGPFSPSFSSDLERWRLSMQALLELDCDILAEGHYGIFRPAVEVAGFIYKQLGMH
ncbi:hypothetical protein DFAR_1240006 [Desulfarculales bacterium]